MNILSDISLSPNMLNSGKNMVDADGYQPLDVLERPSEAEKLFIAQEIGSFPVLMTGKYSPSRFPTLVAFLMFPLLLRTKF